MMDALLEWAMAYTDGYLLITLVASLIAGELILSRYPDVLRGRARTTVAVVAILSLLLLSGAAVSRSRLSYEAWASEANRWAAGVMAERVPGVGRVRTGGDVEVLPNGSVSVGFRATVNRVPGAMFLVVEARGGYSWLNAFLAMHGMPGLGAKRVSIDGRPAIVFANLDACRAAVLLDVVEEAGVYNWTFDLRRVIPEGFVDVEVDALYLYGLLAENETPILVYPAWLTANSPPKGFPEEAEAWMSRLAGEQGVVVDFTKKLTEKGSGGGGGTDGSRMLSVSFDAPVYGVAFIYFESLPQNFSEAVLARLGPGIHEITLTPYTSTRWVTSAAIRYTGLRGGAAPALVYLDEQGSGKMIVYYGPVEGRDITVRYNLYALFGEAPMEIPGRLIVVTPDGCYGVPWR